MAPSTYTAAPASAPAAPLAPLVAAQLDFLLSDSTLPVKVVQIWSGCRNRRYADRFTLGIPFCLDYVYWDVMYNAMYPKVAPDVLFGPDDEGFQPLVDYDDTGNGDKSCLAQWDFRDPRGLMCLVKELRLLYIEYQKKRVAEVDDARLKFEISTVLAKEGIEVCMVSLTDRPDEVKFAVPLLDLDFTKLVPGCPWKFPQKIHLQAIYPVSRSYPSVPPAPRLKLISTPDLKSLFSVDGFKLPTWIDGMCMAEYIPLVEEHLQIQVVEASASIGSRRRFIEALAPTFGRPLEADAVLSCHCLSLIIADFTMLFNKPVYAPDLLQESYSSFHFRDFHFSGSLCDPPSIPKTATYPDVAKFSDRDGWYK